MKRFQCLLSALVASQLLITALNTPSASAQAAYGSYVGVGPAVGFGQNSHGDGSGVSGVVAARYKLLELPVSVRAQAYVGNGFAVVPTVSYDLPLNWQTDVYLGAGVALAGGNTPVGDKVSLALQPGIDYIVPKSNTVFFGNAVIAFDAYRNGGGTAFAVQGGVGLRF